jgi:ATP synthase protein I
MSETPSRGDGPGSATPVEDPWAAFGYLVAGVLFYGVIGWGLSLWLHASYWIPIGILVGAGFGMFMVFSRYRFHGNDSATANSSIFTPADQPPTDRPPSGNARIVTHDAHDLGAVNRPASDDQGETA